MTSLLTTRQVALRTGLSVARVRQLAPKYAYLAPLGYGGSIWLWDDEALVRMGQRRKAPGSGRRKVN